MDEHGGLQIRGSLGRAAARGVRWNLVETIFRQVARLTVMVAIARIIGPEAYGVVALATTYIVLVDLLLDQGFGAALIQKKDLRDADVAAALWFNLGAAVGLAAITVVAAPAVASFFHTFELTAVLRVLSLGVLLRALAVVPASLLTRAMRFRHLALGHVASLALGGAVGLWLALEGASYWAVVVQILVQHAVFAAVVFPAADPARREGSVAALKGMWRYSVNVLGGKLVNYFGRNVDNILIGRFLGAGPLALYSMAYRAHLLPTHVLSRAVNRVAFPAFSRLQDERARIRAYFLFSSRAMALVSFPSMTLLILLAPDLVRTVLGTEWMAAVVPMQVLAFTAARQSVQTVAGPVFMGCGRADWQFRVDLALLATRVAGFAAGLPWGIVGVAVGYAIADLLFHPLVVHLVGRLVGLDLKTYVRELIPATAGAVALALTWILVAEAAGLVGTPRLLTVGGASGLAGLAYLAVMRLLSPRAIPTLLRAVAGRAPPPAPVVTTGDLS